MSRWAELTGSLTGGRLRRDRRAPAATLAAEFRTGSAIVALDAAGGETADPATVVHRRAAAPFAERMSRPAVAEVLAGADLLATLSRNTRSERTRLSWSARRASRSLYAVPLLVKARSRSVGLSPLPGSASSPVRGRPPRAHVDARPAQAPCESAVRSKTEVTVLLQQSLLPDELASAEGMEITAHYRAGVAEHERGRDWYDAVRRPDGIVHFTVGDVAGESRRRWRWAAPDRVPRLRARARSPAAIVQRLGRHIAVDGMATTVCATYDPYTQEPQLRLGGPPAAAPGRSRRGTVAASSLRAQARLGGHAERTAGRDGLAGDDAGPALDGLVERRDAGLDEGIDRLAAAVLEALKAGTSNPADAVVAEIVEPQAEDDLALLLVGFQGFQRASDRPSCRPLALLRGLRGRVRAWLEARGLARAPTTSCSR